MWRASAVAIRGGVGGVRDRQVLQVHKGWGAISSPELPPGLDAFIPFGNIMGQSGYREFAAGDRVEFEYVPAQQDSFQFVATWARRLTDTDDAD
jgi:CspA family cold shock protein